MRFGRKVNDRWGYDADYLQTCVGGRSFSESRVGTNVRQIASERLYDSIPATSLLDGACRVGGW